MIYDELKWSLVLALKRSLSSSAVARTLLLPAILLSAPMTPLCSPILLLSNLPKSTMYSLPTSLYLFRQTGQASTVSMSLYQVFQSPHKLLIVLTKSVTEARIKCKLKWAEWRWIMLFNHTSSQSQGCWPYAGRSRRVAEHWQNQPFPSLSPKLDRLGKPWIPWLLGLWSMREWGSEPIHLSIFKYRKM